jgi:hypothetical protein
LPSEKERKRKEQAKERARKRERERAIEQQTNAAATAALFSLSLFLSAFFSRALSLPARGLERASLLSVPRGIGHSRAINWKKKKERKKGNRRSIASTFSLFDLFSSPSLPETHPGSLSRLPLASKHTQPIWNQKTDSSNRSKSEARKKTANTMQGQDWNPIILSKKRPTTKDATSSKAVNAALRSGAAVETVKKFTAGTNRSGAGPLKDAAKLDRETEELAHER